MLEVRHGSADSHLPGSTSLETCAGAFETEVLGAERDSLGSVMALSLITPVYRMSACCSRYRFDIFIARTGIGSAVWSVGFFNCVVHCNVLGDDLVLGHTRHTGEGQRTNSWVPRRSMLSKTGILVRNSRYKGHASPTRKATTRARNTTGTTSRS